MVSRYGVSPASRLIAAQLKSAPSPLAATRTSWRTSLPPAFMTNSVSLRILAELGIELRRDGSPPRGCSWTISQRHLGALADQQMADRADQRRALARPGARRWSPWRRRRRAPAGAHAPGRRPARSAVRSAVRASRLGDVDEIAVGDEGGVERADRVVVAVAASSAGAKLPSASFSARRCTVTPSIAGNRFASDRRSGPAARRSLRPAAAAAWPWLPASKAGTVASRRRRSV